MRKLLKSMTAFMVFMFAAVIVFAEGSLEATEGQIDILDLLLTPEGILALSVIVTGWITKAIKTSGLASQIISWVIPIGLCFIGDAKNVGHFADHDVIYTVVIGFGLALVGNALYDMGGLKSILAAFFAKKDNT